MKFSEARLLLLACREDVVSKEDYTKKIIQAMHVASNLTSKKSLTGQRVIVAKAAPIIQKWFGPPPTNVTMRWLPTRNILIRHCASHVVGTPSTKGQEALAKELRKLHQAVATTELTLAQVRVARDSFQLKAKKHLGVTL